MSNDQPEIRTCQVTEQDNRDWWEEFLASDRIPASRTGIISGDRMFLFAQFERDVPADPPILRGIADFTVSEAERVTKVIYPVINTAATNAAFADAENSFITRPYSTVRQYLNQNIISIPFMRVRTNSPNRLNEPYYDGLWSCILKNSLSNGDTIEFGAGGSRSFEAHAIWECRF